MDRRRFVGSVAGGLLAVPLAARAQKSATPVIGFLSSASPAQWTRNVVAFRQGLNEAGYAEGKNVAIEFRWAEGHYDSLPKLAADLVRRQVAVVVASGGNVSALAAKAATSTIPIVCTGLHRQDPQRRQTGRSAGVAADEGRAGDQSQDREGAWTHNSTIAAAARGRGDSVTAAPPFKHWRATSIQCRQHRSLNVRFS